MNTEASNRHQIVVYKAIESNAVTIFADKDSIKFNFKRPTSPAMFQLMAEHGFHWDTELIATATTLSNQTQHIMQLVDRYFEENMS